jgi:hypothetical protein
MANEMISDQEWKMTNEEIIVTLKERLSALHCTNKDLRRDNAILTERAINAENSLAPVKRSLELLSSEKSRWLRKERRAT